MTAKIPNDIFQYSTTGALYAGYSNHGPSIDKLPNYGTYGIGAFAPEFDELLFLDSQPYQITSNEPNVKGNLVQKASSDAALSFAMVTTFVPEYQISVNGEIEKDDLLDLFSTQGPDAGGQNSFMPFRIRGEFSRVTVTTGRWSARATLPEAPEEFHFDNVKGIIFGFIGPQWAKGVSIHNIHCYFMRASEDTAKLEGGRVVDFRGKVDVEVNWAVTGRFHLGFPRGEAWEGLDIVKPGLSM